MTEIIACKHYEVICYKHDCSHGAARIFKCHLCGEKFIAKKKYCRSDLDTPLSDIKEVLEWNGFLSKCKEGRDIFIKVKLVGIDLSDECYLIEFRDGTQHWFDCDQIGKRKL